MSRKKRGIIQVATCQFATSANVKRNSRQIHRQIEQAASKSADVAHFPECALSGYPGPEFDSWEGFDWELLRAEMESICRLAKKHKLWVILGTAHRLTGKHLPHNSLYAINSSGKIVERYDKRFCTGGDLRFFSPGDHCSVFDINGIRCGMLICYDVRFPELYRAYQKEGTQLLFDSFWNARAEGPNIHTTIMRPTLQARAATNYFWISATNSSAHYQSWPGVLIRPNGEFAASLKTDRAGVMVNTVDTIEKLYDASSPWRERSMKGHLNSGKTVKDARSRDRACF
ncbi:MAG: carbon-nitrogen hydrolase family protein [Planctomycetota bacterium]|jgi:predicted amidohydrolase|nr:carbon-nitrogen hydrolase family protein [Planctomycetota bacterium]MDP7251344.1 carbon-nitrogen hydrolase family protein [Planctomycetota bacterium]